MFVERHRTDVPQPNNRLNGLYALFLPIKTMVINSKKSFFLCSELNDNAHTLIRSVD